MQANRTLDRLVSDTERSLSQKKDAVRHHMEEVSEEGKSGRDQLQAVLPTEALKVFFDHVPLKSIPGLDNVGVLEIHADQTIEEAVRLLHKNDVLGAPIVDQSINSDTSTSASDPYIGLVDLASIILWALEEFEAAETQAQVRGLVDKAAVVGEDDFWSALSRNESIGKAKIGALARSFRWGPFLPVSPHDSLLHILLILSKHSLKAAPVVDSKEKKVKGFITQNAAMQLLLQCSGLSWFDIIAEKPLSDFSFVADTSSGQLGVVSISGDKPILDAFHSLWRNRISAIPVIDSKTNRLIGSIRVTDSRILLDNDELFRGRRTVTTEQFMEAGTPHDHVNVERTLSAEEEELGVAISAATLSLGFFKLPAMREPVTSSPEDTLKDTIRKLVRSRSDRSFMVDENRRLIGVITLRDIMVQFSPPLGEEPGRWADLFDDAFEGI